MDINSLKMNMGLLEQFIEKKKNNRTVIRSSLLNVLQITEEQRIELGHFMAEVDDLLAEVHKVCQV